MFSQPVELPILEVHEEAHETRTFRLSLEGHKPFAFQPGQFVMLSMPAEPKLQRAYSIASAPYEATRDGGEFIDLTMNLAGVFTHEMFSLKPGNRINVRGPFGKFVLDEDERHCVMIAGGTGVTPFRSFIRHLRHTRASMRLSLFYSFRTPRHLIFGNEFTALAARGELDLHLSVTRPGEMGAGEHWSGATGRITPDVVATTLPDFAEASFYLCGPATLVDGMAAGLKERGIPPARLRHEKWGE